MLFKWCQTKVTFCMWALGSGYNKTSVLKVSLRSALGASVASNSSFRFVLLTSALLLSDISLVSFRCVSCSCCFTLKCFHSLGFWSLCYQISRLVLNTAESKIDAGLLFEVSVWPMSCLMGRSMTYTAAQHQEVTEICRLYMSSIFLYSQSLL